MPAATTPRAHIDISRLEHCFDEQLHQPDCSSQADVALIKARWIKAAVNRNSALVFPGEVITGDVQVAFSFPLEAIRTRGELIVLSAIGPDDEIALLIGKQVLNAFYMATLT